ncbi:uncharacterized protein LOC130010772 [Patella vulgata]|uniref:uncharacterized protein LOC130010772 n=1 Tax=Patella vulgata TaxID=6465 RepID=UPI0024A8B0CC|nr:uncharacterized protein LOC130010772 [Patella vulgata]
MNEEILAHHTKLHNWFELDKLSKNSYLADVPGNKGHHLNPIKAKDIDSWRTEVNKIYNKKPKSARRPLFRQCHHSAPFERDFSEVRTQRVKSAPPLDRKLKLEKYNEPQSIVERLNNISIHYNSERGAIPRIEISKPTTSATEFADGKSGDVDTDSVLREESFSIYNDNNSTQTEVGSSEEKLSKSNRLRIFYHKDKPMVSIRSVSNGLLNCLTVDDCRIAARYKPNNNIVTTMRENVQQEESSSLDGSVDLPMKISSGSAFTTMSILEEKDKIFRENLAKRNKRNKIKVHQNINGLQNSLDTNRSGNWMKPVCDTYTDEKLSSDKQASEGGPLYRKMNSALHKKMHKLVNAKKDKLHKIYLGDNSVNKK